MRPLLHDDGENQAVRTFLMFYGSNPTLTHLQMMFNMQHSGYPYFPSWVGEVRDETMTKAAAQDWLRYLFSLENKE